MTLNNLRRERTLVFLVGAIQFVNVLDFMMVMPMGPDFAAALGIPGSELGLIGGAYTLSAAFSGVLGSLFLDRFDRRQALAVSMLGLVVGTAAGGLATGLPSLILARVIAGAFGGPAAALSFAIIADSVPVERRGQAMGAVMGAFSVASVFGVPAGLELARVGGWRLPFFAVAGIGLVVAASALFVMPPMRSHLARAKDAVEVNVREMLTRPAVMLSLTAMFFTMISSFSVVPNISAYFQFNLGYPRAGIGTLYLVGGLISFVLMRAAGRVADRFGATVVAAVSTLLLVSDLVFGFVHPVALPVMTIFLLFMTANSIRGVALSTLSSLVPRPHERARFMSSMAAVQHAAAAIGAFASSRMLTERPDRSLAGMDKVAVLALATGVALPFLLALVTAALKRSGEAMRPAGAVVLE